MPWLDAPCADTSFPHTEEGREHVTNNFQDLLQFPRWVLQEHTKYLQSVLACQGSLDQLDATLRALHLWCRSVNIAIVLVLLRLLLEIMYKTFSATGRARHTWRHVRPSLQGVTHVATCRYPITEPPVPTENLYPSKEAIFHFSPSSLILQIRWHQQVLQNAEKRIFRGPRKIWVNQRFLCFHI